MTLYIILVFQGIRSRVTGVVSETIIKWKTTHHQIQDKIGIKNLNVNYKLFKWWSCDVIRNNLGVIYLDPVKLVLSFYGSQILLS